MKTAELMWKLPNELADQRLYWLSEPMISYDGEIYEYVIVSKVANETYIFPASLDGEPADWVEMQGSMKGSHTHEEVLFNAGYSVLS